MNESSDLAGTITRRRVLAVLGTVVTVMIAAGIGLSTGNGFGESCPDGAPEAETQRTEIEEKSRDLIDGREKGGTTEC